VKNCVCSEEDWECDVNYIRGSEGSCAAMKKLKSNKS